jgi:hypothetical protein
MAVAESLAISQITKTPANIDARAIAEAAVNAGKAFTTATVERDELKNKCDELSRQLLLTKQRVLGYKGPRNASGESTTLLLLLHFYIFTTTCPWDDNNCGDDGSLLYSTFFILCITPFAHINTTNCFSLMYVLTDLILKR